jgi:uncharacterized membrane protein
MLWAREALQRARLAGQGLGVSRNDLAWLGEDHWMVGSPRVRPACAFRVKSPVIGVFLVTAPIHGSDDDRRPGTPDMPGLAAEAEAKAEARSADRVVTFSDAVVAIAITLLALDLPLPGRNQTNVQFWDELRNNGIAYLAFLISFLVVFNHWSTHRQIFRYVCRLNHRVSQLNMLWLLLMIVVPYATKIVTGGGQLGPRFTVYAVIQILATGCSLAMSREVRVAHLLRTDAPDSARHFDPVPELSMIVVYLLSIPVAYVAGSWAFALWALSPLVGRVLRRTHAVDRLAVDDD